MSEVDIRAAAAPKSDQLNAEDLIGAARTVTVTDVTAGSNEQPIIVHFEGDGGRPYKPCKSMLRVMIAAWGDKGKDWVGKSMTLYHDPEVMFAGVQVGGIRISHVSDIDHSISLSLTATRGKRKPYRVDPLKAEAPTEYPGVTFRDNLPKWRDAIEAGKLTVDQVIDRAEKKGKLTDDQKAAIREPVEREPGMDDALGDDDNTEDTTTPNPEEF